MALSKRTRDSLVQKRIDELSEQNTGDAGIDIVALHEWSDIAEAIPTYFAQCAAQQENWPEKRFEAHAVTHEKYFNFFHKPGSIMFIPLCYRSPDGNWIDSDGHQNIIIDRVRIIELLEKQVNFDGGILPKIMEVISDPFNPGCFKKGEDGQEQAA